MQLKSSVPPSSSKAPFRLMLVEDNDGFRGTVHRFATAKGFVCSSYANPVLAISDIGDFRPDVILTDFQLPNMDGLQLLQAVHASDPALPVVLMSGKGNFELAIDALRAGAFDLLAKPFESLELAMLQVSRAAQHRRLGEHNRALEAELARHQPFGELVGESPAMLNVYRFIETVAPTNCPVLIFGESGTGKELVVRSIHERSERARARLVSLNCAAIPSSLLESELFGHVKGAFTGASTSRGGLFELAHGGTIFLDELGQLSSTAQAQLLRTLQNGEVRPVGSDSVRKVDVRVLAATNADLSVQIAAGEFRRDLFYRLNVFSIQLPPLRERGRDALLLAQYFLARLQTRTGKSKVLSEGAERAILAYDWPGNVRELENAIERAHAFSNSTVIEEGHFPTPDLGQPESSEISVTQIERGGTSPDSERLFRLPYSEAKKTMLAQFEIAYSREVMIRAGGNFAEAARLAGLDRSNLRRMLRKVKSPSQPSTQEIDIVPESADTASGSLVDTHESPMVLERGEGSTGSLAPTTDSTESVHCPVEATT